MTKTAIPTKMAKALAPEAPVLLIWNEARVRVIHQPVTNKSGRLSTRPVRLNPGVNEISADVWAALQERKGIQADLENGRLKLVVTSKGAVASKTPATLEDLDADEAITLVKNTMDDVLLKVWSKAEKRKQVAAAIDTQIEALENAANEKKGE